MSEYCENCRKQAEQIEQNKADMDKYLNQAIDMQDEIKRLKELIANGSPYIDEEWDNAHSFGLPSFVKWLEDMQAEIKAAPPQKGE